MAAVMGRWIVTPGRRWWWRHATRRWRRAVHAFKHEVPDPTLGKLFESCFSNTLTTTVSFEESDGRADTFVITGDIEAMWLRDSTAQVWCYLGLAAEDAQIRKMLGGVHQSPDRLHPDRSLRQRLQPGGHGRPLAERTTPTWSRKFTSASGRSIPCVTRSGWHTVTGARPATPACSTAAGPRPCAWSCKPSASSSANTASSGPYLFQRNAREATDTLPIRGRGNPVVPVGMICSAFRPSDDATIFPFLIPSNLFAVVSLRQLAAILTAMDAEPELAAECGELAREVEQAVDRVRRARASQIRAHLCLRGRWVRRARLHGRCQRAEPAFPALPGMLRAGRSRLSRHAAIRVERG